MTAHQPLGQLAVALGDGIDDELMLLEGIRGAVALHAELTAIHACQVVEVVAQDIDQAAIAAPLNDAEVEVEIPSSWK
jgi:metal-sulfur cluster biosynthetic enzyme